MTPFFALSRLAGLSIRETSEFLRVPINTANKWAQGARNAPPGVIGELTALIIRQDRAAREALEIIRSQNQARIELGHPADDDEARSLGWPCRGAWGAVAARIVAGTNTPVKLVPWGNTVATAAASDTHKFSN